MCCQASFSEDTQSIICGSETGAVLIWDTVGKRNSGLFGKSNRNHAYECFQCTRNTDVATTVALFAPSSTVHQIIKCEIENDEFCLQQSHIHNNHINNNNTNNNTNTNTNDNNNNTNNKHDSKNMKHLSLDISDQFEMHDLCTRVMVTADYDGIVRVYFRVV